MRGLIGSSRCGQRGTLGYLTGLFEFTELFLGLFELFLESWVGVQTGHGDRTCDTSGIDIALEMITADDAALAHLISAFQDLVLTFGIDLGQYQSGGPSD